MKRFRDPRPLPWPELAEFVIEAGPHLEAWICQVEAQAMRLVTEAGGLVCEE